MTQPTPRVMMIGLKASAVDYDKWPELSREKLEAAMQDVMHAVQVAGYTAQMALVDAKPDAVREIAGKLAQFQPDVVVIGAGIRKDPDHLHLFEAILNTVTQEAPSAKIAFNAMPHDTLEAIARWV